MATISECNNRINQYNIMKDNLNSIVSSISSYNDSYTNVKIGLEQNYSINDLDSNIYVRNQKLYKDINETSNYIKNTVIPAISDAISKEKSTINYINAQLAAATQSNTSQNNTEKQTENKVLRCPVCKGELTAAKFCKRCRTLRTEVV